MPAAMRRQLLATVGLAFLLSGLNPALAGEHPTIHHAGVLHRWTSPRGSWWSMSGAG